MEEKEIYKLAMEKFGKEHQVIIMIEEMAELTKELVKFLRGKMDIDHLLEEMADVEIVLEQVKLIFGGIEFFYMKEKKLERLKERLESNNMEALK